MADLLPNHEQGARKPLPFPAAVVVLGIAAACAGCAAPRRPEPPTGPHFSVLTYNVNYGMPAPNEALRAIREADPDIVCLQETTPAWERRLELGLEGRYAWSRFHHSGGAGGLGLFSRWPVEEVAFEPSPAGWFPAWVVKIETPVGPIQILNVHLRPAVTERGGFSVSAYLFTNSAAHVREMKAFDARLAPDVPALVVGDFNEGDGGAAIGRLRGRGFTDALPEFDRSDTWKWDTSVGAIGKRLDHVLYSKGLYCLGAHVIEAGASDHYPVWARFEKRD